MMYEMDYFIPPQGPSNRIFEPSSWPEKPDQVGGLPTKAQLSAWRPEEAC